MPTAAHAPPLPVPHLPAPQEPGTSQTGALLVNFAHTPLTKQELDAARNCVATSQHTSLTLLPNHVMYR